MQVEEVVAAELSELDAAVLRWWDLMLAHAMTQPDADLLVADAWAETGRLIGNVQLVSEPVGTDRGTRVVLKVPAIAAAVQQAEFSAESTSDAHSLLWKAFERTRKRLLLEGRFVSLWGAEPAWTCYYCEEGEPVADPCFVAKTG